MRISRQIFSAKDRMLLLFPYIPSWMLLSNLNNKEGWTHVTGKRSRHKVPARLRRLRAPPHVRASLPSSDSSAGETSDSDCSLHIPDGADVQYSPHGGQPGLRVTSKSTSSWTPISSRTRSKFK